VCVRDRKEGEEMGAPLITATITARVESFFLLLLFLLLSVSPSFLPCYVPYQRLFP